MDAFHRGSPKFSSPEEEIAFLREEIRKKEETLGRFKEHLPESGAENAGERVSAREEIIREQVQEYKQLPREEMLAPGYRMEPTERGEIVLHLAPETHDRQMGELLGVLTERGIMNALSIVEEMENPHLEDDFHRILVQYLKEAEKTDPEMKNSDRLFQALHMTLFEVTLPPAGKEEAEQDRYRERTLRSLLEGMEHFYQGMMSVDTDEKKRSDRNYFSLEIALPHIGEEVVFYAAVPDAKKGLFEKQVLAMFPKAKVVENADDYNIFNAEGVSLGAYGESSEHPALPLKAHDDSTEDPLNVILNVFSKLEKEGEGAAIQILVSPMGDEYRNSYRRILYALERGVEFHIALEEATPMTSIMKGALREGASLFGFAPHGSSAKLVEDRASGRTSELKEINRKRMDRIGLKLATPVLATNIRVVASAANRARAEEILEDLKSSFHQFTDPEGNGFRWKKLEGSKLERFFYDYSFRLFSPDHTFPLNVKELATIFHFPTAKVTQPALKEARAGSAPAPINTSPEGVILGTNEYRGEARAIRFAKEDRVRHFYCIGQTGTGKTTLMKNMIIQDIANGDGVCYIDPHGTDMEDILANIPENRVDDVIYFDPGHMPRPMGLNMLEYDANYPEQKTFVVNELLSIFNKLFDMKVAGGPAFEQYFRNASLLVMEHPESGNTLLEIGRVMGDKAFREMKLAHCMNPIIKQFWANAERTTGEQSLANFVPYITNKFDVFISNDIMRPIVAQERSAFNFRDIMDKRKIFLVNLSKGRLGDINSHLIGLIMVGKILMAALSRVDVLGRGEPPPDFYLYIDEFQNITTDSIATILSEARKYRLSLNIAHQFISQLEEKIRDSVFGNVGSMAVFRVGAEDAEFLEKQYAPVFTASDIMKIENFNAYVKMLIGGSPAKPFNMRVTAPAKGYPEIVSQIKELSHLKYGRDRAEIEAEIMAKYQAGTKSGAPASTTSTVTPQNG